VDILFYLLEESEGSLKKNEREFMPGGAPMLQLCYELSHKLVSDASKSHLYVLVKVAAPQIEMKKRRPLNLGLVLDRSGSMEGDKITFCKHASKFLVSQLASDDILSIVTFDDRIDVVLPAQKVANKDLLKTQIERIFARGSTNLSGGWLAASGEVLKNLDPERINRIILLTDGQANQGVTDTGSLLRIGADLAQKNISTTTMGFGKDFVEDLLKGIADAGQGNFYFIDSPEKAPRTFSEELSELLAIFAQNLTLTINPSEQVEFLGVHHDYQSVHSGKEIKVTLGDIFAGDEKSILVEFITPASKAGSEAGISVLNLSYQQVYEEVSFKELTAFVKVGYGHHDEVASQTINPIVNRELLICGAVKARQDAVKDADKGDIKSAKEILQKTIDNLKKSAFSDDEIFREEIRRLESLVAGFETREAYAAYGRKESLYGSVTLSKMKGAYSSARSKIVPWEIIDALKSFTRVTVITGSGLAQECAIPGIRGVTCKRGDEDVKVFAPETWQTDPDRVWASIKEAQEVIVNLELKESYKVIAEMEDYWMDFQLISENVDGLHRIAGNKKIIELYGTIFQSRCTAEGKVLDAGTRGSQERVCSCGNPLRPDVLWLGEEFDETLVRRIQDILLNSEAVIIVGSSFHRKQEFIFKAKEKGALIVEINPARLAFSGASEIGLQRGAEDILPKLWKEIKQ
jgi:Ca-activated chloride channel homolog